MHVILLTASLLAVAYPATESAKPTVTGPIASQYRETAERIIQASLAGNDAWSKMEQLCLGIPTRLSGSKGMERAVAWGIETLKKDGQENVRGEPVMVPHWVRGEESAEILKPVKHPMLMLGLGGSVGTPVGGITAAVVVVGDEKELDALGDGARGKIVLFNKKMPDYDPVKGSGYGKTVYYRTNGARLAAKYGAVASLVRSVTAHSLRTPHTGAMRYGDAENKIPSAAITVEDAETIAGLTKMGQEVVVRLKMNAQTLPDAQSANVIGELRGSSKPEEIVVISGHLDAWDVGHGAHDDGGGCVIAMEAINVLRKMKLIPRRTIRVILWTNEENGLRGGKAYAKEHVDEMPLHVAAIESDSGVFEPRGYSVQCEDEGRQARAAEQLRDAVSLLSSLAPVSVTTGHSGADISPMKPHGVMLMGHRVEGSIYFDYHHTHADTLDKVDPVDLSKNVAALATMAYILADMPGRLGDGAANEEQSTK